MSSPRRSTSLKLSVLCVALPACVAKAPNAESGLRVTPGVGMSSKPTEPLAEPSEEATADQLLLARDQGRHTGDALQYFLEVEAPGGVTMAAGEYELSVALLSLDAGPNALHRRAHLAVVPRDGADGRLVPGLDVTAIVHDERGQRVAALPLAFVCDPLIHHYGTALDLPSSGPFSVELHVRPLELRRHDPLNGDRFKDEVYAKLDGVRLSSALPADPAKRESLARAEGMAAERALATMLHGVAVDGGEAHIGEYLVDYAVEYAEGSWQREHGDLVYAREVDESTELNAHVEVAVRDAATGRIFPNLAVSATLSRDGERVGTHRQHLMWHPWLYHYGENWRVPGSGRYALDVQIEPTPCLNRDGRSAPVPAHTVNAHFDGVHIRTGQK